MSTKTYWRMAAALVASIAAAIVVGASASGAHAQGVSWQELDARGWTCFVPPPFPDRVGCFNPGHGAPIAGNPDPPPSYSVRMFSRASGEFLHTVHLIRADLYAGQPCGDHAYRFIDRIGYWECVHE